jgi:hypothetical protein
MENNVGKDFLTNSIEEFGKLKKLADKALAQLEAKDYHWQPDKESNSIAIIMKHVSGNMISRWTDFLTTDGEKPNRNRDDEFIDDVNSVESITAAWERGWARLFETLKGLTENDVLKIITIRNEPHTVIKAIIRQLAHYGNHIGQIVWIAKHLRSDTWQTLSMPRRK